MDLSYKNKYLTLKWIVYLWIMTSSSTVDCNKTEQPLQELRDNLTTALGRMFRCYNSSGLAVSVLKGDREILTRGFGHSDLSTCEPMGPNTQFVLASISKGFTSTLIGALLSHQNLTYPLGFDTLVVDVMGRGFQMPTYTRTRYATIKDLLAHRLGILAYRWPQMMAMDPTISKMEYCRRMKYLKPGRNSFRDKFLYSNFMYVLAGCVAERLGGDRPYSTLIKQYLFDPLEMTNSTTVGALLQKSERSGEKGWPKSLSRNYYLNETSLELQEISLEVIRTTLFLEAAGGVVSTLNDMNKWMRMLLRGGKTKEGRGLMLPRYWSELFKPHLPYTAVPSASYPVQDTREALGLGWMIGYYRGYPKRIHEGGMYGFVSRITHLPLNNITIFTFTNGPQHKNIYLIRAAHVVIQDTLLDLEPWLNATTQCTYPQPWAKKKDPPPVPKPLKKISRDDFDDDDDDDEDEDEEQNIEDMEERNETREYPGDENNVNSSPRLQTLINPGEGAPEVLQRETSKDSKCNDPSHSSPGHQRVRHGAEQAPAYVPLGLSRLSEKQALKFSGRFGHKLFGNITISYNTTDGQLYFSYGILGRGRLMLVDDGRMKLDFTEALYYHNRITENANQTIIIDFATLNQEGRYEEVMAVGFEELAPPVFKRGLWWHDDDDDDDDHDGGIDDEDKMFFEEYLARRSSGANWVGGGVRACFISAAAGLTSLLAAQPGRVVLRWDG